MNALDRARHRRAFAPILVALALLAWAALWIWSRSAQARWLTHDDWTAVGPAAALCRAWPGTALALTLLASSGAWVLMILAMMLPTMVPLVGTFERVVAARSDRVRLLVLLVLGYVGAWGAFGLLAHGARALLMAGVDRSPWLSAHGALVGAGLLALAGAFQFSRLKERCLDRCRSPVSFVTSHWHGRAAARQAFLLGVDHGVFCVGCCWALMLLTFLVGMGSLAWMLALGTVMAVEKNVAWGPRLSGPVGAALLVGAVGLAATSV